MYAYRHIPKYLVTMYSLRPILRIGNFTSRQSCNLNKVSSGQHRPPFIFSEIFQSLSLQLHSSKQLNSALSCSCVFIICMQNRQNLIFIAFLTVSNNFYLFRTEPSQFKNFLYILKCTRWLHISYKFNAFFRWSKCTKNNGVELYVIDTMVCSAFNKRIYDLQLNK